MVIHACLLGVVWLPGVLASICLTADSVFPNFDAVGCQNYYSCHDFIPHLHDCPDGFQFHFENLQCQPDVEVWCPWQKQTIGNYGSGRYGSSEEYWDRNYYYDDGMYPPPPMIPFDLPLGPLGPPIELFGPIGPPPGLFDPLGPPPGLFDPLGPPLEPFDLLGPPPNLFSQLGPRGLPVPPPVFPFGSLPSYPPLPPIEIPISMFPREFIPIIRSREYNGQSSVFNPSLTFGYGSKSDIGNSGGNIASISSYIPDYPVFPLYHLTDQTVPPIYPPPGPYIPTDLPYPLFPSIDSIPRSGYIPEFSLDSNVLGHPGNLGGIFPVVSGTDYDGGLFSGFPLFSNIDNIPRYGYIPGFSDGLSIDTIPLGYQGNLDGVFPAFSETGYYIGGKNGALPLFSNNIPKYGYIPGFSNGLSPDATSLGYPDGLGGAFSFFGGSGTGSVFPISFSTPQININGLGLGNSGFYGLGVQGLPFPLIYGSGFGIDMNNGGINTRLNTGSNIFGAAPSITGVGLFGGQSGYGSGFTGVSGLGGQGSGLFPGRGSTSISNLGYPNIGFVTNPTSELGYTGTIGVNNQGTGFGYQNTGLGTNGYIPTSVSIPAFSGFGGTTNIQIRNPSGYVPTGLGSGVPSGYGPIPLDSVNIPSRNGYFSNDLGINNYPPINSATGGYAPIGSGNGGNNIPFPIGGLGGSGNYVPIGVNQDGSSPFPIENNFGGSIYSPFGSPSSYIPRSGFGDTQNTVSGGYTPLGFGGTIPALGSGGMFESIPTRVNTGGSGGYVPTTFNSGGYMPTPISTGGIQNNGGYFPNPIGTSGTGGYVPTNLNYGGYVPTPVGAGGVQNAGNGGFVPTGLNAGPTGGYVPTPIGTGSTGGYVPPRSGNAGGYFPSGFGSANTGGTIPNGIGYGSTGGYTPTGLGSGGTGGYVPTGLGTGSTNNIGVFPVGTNANMGGSVVLGGYPGNSYYDNSFSPSNLGYPGSSGSANNYPSNSGNNSPNNLGFPANSAYYPNTSGVDSTSGGFEGFDLGAATVSKLTSVNANSTADATNARTFRSTATDTLSDSVNTVGAIPTTLNVNSTISAALKT